MNDKIDLIYDIVKDIDKKHDKTTERLIRLEEHVDQNTSDLSEHIEGVKQTRELIAHNKEELNQKCAEMKGQINKRMSKMEEPKVAIKLITKWVIGVGSLAGAIYGMLRLYNAL